MICPKCQAKINRIERDMHLHESSEYLTSDKCLKCILKELKYRQKRAYPKLVKTFERHKAIKAAYHKSSKQFTEINDKFKNANYEHNMILHKINMEKQRKEKASATRAKTSTKKTERSIKEAMNKMLANLTPEQREKVLANFTSA